jgi:hypothetical protein
VCFTCLSWPCGTHAPLSSDPCDVRDQQPVIIRYGRKSERMMNCDHQSTCAIAHVVVSCVVCVAGHRLYGTLLSSPHYLYYYTPIYTHIYAHIYTFTFTHPYSYLHIPSSSSTLTPTSTPTLHLSYTLTYTPPSHHLHTHTHTLPHTHLVF